MSRFLLLLCLCCSCTYSASRFFPGRPSKEFQDSLRDASPEFAQGWKDGCESGMSAGTNTFYKMFYRNNAVDGYKMTGSSDYKTAWGNAFWYCYRHDYGKFILGGGSRIWSSVFGGYR